MGAIAIWLIRGVSKATSSENMWSTDPKLRNEGVARIMSRDRYRQIMRCFIPTSPRHPATRSWTWPKKGEPHYDVLGKARQMYDAMRSVLPKLWDIGGVAAVDDILLGSSHHTSLHRYIPTKAHKHGILWFAVCSIIDLPSWCKLTSAYPIHNFKLYQGDEEWKECRCGPQGGWATPHPWDGLGESACFLIKLLSELYTGRSLATDTVIVADRGFSGVKLARWIATMGMRYIGSAKIPPKSADINAPNAHPTLSGRHATKTAQRNLRGMLKWREALWHGANIVVGYWIDTSLVGFVTVNIPWAAAANVARRIWLGTGRTRRRSPSKVSIDATIVQDYYNKYMGSVDAYIKEAHRTYASNERRNRVWKVIFHFLFNMSVYSAFCLYMWFSCFMPHLQYETFKREPQKKFRLKLAEELASKCMSSTSRKRQRRQPNIHGEDGPMELDVVMRHLHKNVREVEGGRKAECAQCRRNNPGAHNATHSSWMCAGCNVNLCRDGDCFLEYHKWALTS